MLFGMQQLQAADGCNRLSYRPRQKAMSQPDSAVCFVLTSRQFSESVGESLQIVWSTIHLCELGLDQAGID